MGMRSKLHGLAAPPPIKNEGTHWERGCVGPTNGLRFLERKSSLPLAGIPTPDIQARSLFTITTELPKLPVINSKRKIRPRVHWMVQPGKAERDTTTLQHTTTQHYNKTLQCYNWIVFQNWIQNVLWSWRQITPPRSQNSVQYNVPISKLLQSRHSLSKKRTVSFTFSLKGRFNVTGY
jgi:hypothetical protein